MVLKLSFINRRQITFLVVFLGIIISISGILFIRSEKNTIRNSRYNELKAIADLKEREILEWLRVKKSEASVTTNSTYFIEGVQKWISDKSDTCARNRLIRRLSITVSILGNENVLMTSPEGIVYHSGKNTEKENSDDIPIAMIKEAVARKEVMLTDFYFGREDSNIHFDIISPVIGKSGKTIAVLVFRTDPSKYLFPLVQEWPTPSKSS